MSPFQEGDKPLSVGEGVSAVLNPLKLLREASGMDEGQPASDRVKVPSNMKHLEERIHAVNDTLKAQGLKTPFSQEALREAAPSGVSKVLQAYEKAGPERAELAKVNQEQTRRMDIERQGPELSR